jgi:hypothetical protein
METDHTHIYKAHNNLVGNLYVKNYKHGDSAKLEGSGKYRRGNYEHK